LLNARSFEEKTGEAFSALTASNISGWDFMNDNVLVTKLPEFPEHWKKNNVKIKMSDKWELAKMFLFYLCSGYLAYS
jgi:hypothetical protein